MTRTSRHVPLPLPQPSEALPLELSLGISRSRGALSLSPSYTLSTSSLGSSATCINEMTRECGRAPKGASWVGAMRHLQVRPRW